MEKKKAPIIAYFYLVIAIGLTIYIIIHSTLNGPNSTTAASPVVNITADVVNTFKPGTIPPVKPDWFVVLVRKLIGHFGLCGLDGIFVFLSCYYLFPIKKCRRSWWSLIPSLSIGLIISLLTEFIQTFIPGRSGDIKDALIDFAGFITASIGVMIIFVIINAIKKHHSNKKNAIA